MPRFFIPGYDGEQADLQYRFMRLRCVREMSGPVSDRRIFAIHFRHNGARYYAEVGKPDPENRQETVRAIFESQDCSMYGIYFRSSQDGRPTGISASQVHRVVDFDADEPGA